jgi:hypothetical protein
MPHTIDFTPQLAASYSRLIEGPPVTDAEVHYEAIQIMRGLESLDLSDALHDLMHAFKWDTIKRVDPAHTGRLVQEAIREYCERIARRKLEAA